MIKPETSLKRWRVETQVTSSCTYYVEAADEKDAEAASVDASPEYSEDINEETMAITEVDANGKPVVRA